MDGQTSESNELSEEELKGLATLDASYLCPLIDCGVIGAAQFVILAVYLTPTAIQSILKALEDKTLRRLLLAPEGLQKVLPIIVNGLGKDNVVARARRWMLDATAQRLLPSVKRFSEVVLYVNSSSTKLLLAQQIDAQRTEAQPPSSTDGIPATEPTTTAHPSTSHSNFNESAPASSSPHSRSILPAGTPRNASSPTEPQVTSRPTPPIQPSQPCLSATPSQSRPASSPSSKLPPALALPSPPRFPSPSNLPSVSSLLQLPDSLRPPLPTTLHAQSHPSSTSLPSLRQQPLPPSPSSQSVESPLRSPPPDTYTFGLVDFNEEVVPEENGDGNVHAEGDEHCGQCDDGPDEDCEYGFPFTTVNPFDRAVNDARVREHGLEAAVDRNPYHISPFCTKWMYKDRMSALKMNDEQYSELLNDEYTTFFKLPPASRYWAGKPMSGQVKFDWAARVFIFPMVVAYAELEGIAAKDYLNNCQERIYARLPDLDHSHPRRDIAQDGQRKVKDWWANITKYIQTKAGRVRTAMQSLNGRLEMLNGKSSSKKLDISKALGLSRAPVNYVLWGKTAGEGGGLDICDPLVSAEMERWSALPSSKEAMALDGRAYGQHRVNFEATVRRTQFALLPQETQDEWTRCTKAGVEPTTDFERQALAESLLLHYNDIIGKGSSLADLHAVVLISGVVSGGRIPVFVKEFGVKPGQTPFLSDQEIGGRTKEAYRKYAGDRFKGDPNDILPLMKSEEELDLEATLRQKDTRSKPKAKAAATATRQAPLPGSTGVPATTGYTGSSISQWSPPSSQSHKERVAYLTKFLSTTYHQNFTGQLRWNTISAKTSHYIEPQRQPSDADGSPLLFMHPQGMPPNGLFRSWWDYMEASAANTLPHDQVFCWKPETTRANLPALAPPPSSTTHMSGQLSRVTNTKKSQSKKAGRKALQTSSKRKKNRRDTLGDNEDLSGELAAILEDTQPSVVETEAARSLRPRVVRDTETEAPALADLGDLSDVESGGSGSEYEPLHEDDKQSPTPLTSKLPQEDDKAEESSLIDDTIPFDPPALSPTSFDEPSIPSPSASNPITARIPPVPHPSRQSTSESSPWPNATEAITTSDVQSTPTVLNAQIISRSSPAPTHTRSFEKVSLIHPSLRDVEGELTPCPAWEQIYPLWEVWAASIMYTNVRDIDIWLVDPADPKPDTLQVASAITAAVSIHQIFAGIQKPNPHLPTVPLVEPSPTCGLDNVHPHHHLRQIVEAIMDVEAPLPSFKTLDTNLMLTVEATGAFLGVIEESLLLFIKNLTSSTDTIRYAEVELFTTLRLALFVKRSVFMVDEGVRGPTEARVTSLLNRLVSTLSAVAALRYWEGFIGVSVDKWWAEELQDSTRQIGMWSAVRELWRVAVVSMANALAKDRQDILQHRAVHELFPSPIVSVINNLMLNPPWWSPAKTGPQRSFTIGLKQFIPSEELLKGFPKIPWSRLSFLDRASVLLVIVLCAIQLKNEPNSSPALKLSSNKIHDSLVNLFTTRCRDLREAIESSGHAEDGRKHAEDSSSLGMRSQKLMRNWVKVWESERGPSEGMPLHPAVEFFQSLPEPEHVEASLLGHPIPPEALDDAESTTVPAQDVNGTTPTRRKRKAEAESDTEPALKNSSTEAPESASKRSRNEDDAEEMYIEAIVLEPGQPAKKKRSVRNVQATAPPTSTAGTSSKTRLRHAQVEEKARAERARELQKEREGRPKRQVVKSSQSATQPKVASSGFKGESSPRKSKEIATSPKKPKPKATAAKIRALSNSSAPSMKPAKLTKKQARAEATRKAMATKAANKARKADLALAGSL